MFTRTVFLISRTHTEFLVIFLPRWELIYSMIVSRIKKILLWWIRFCRELSHSHVLSRVADQGPSSTVTFFRITSKMLKFGTCHFTTIEKNIKARFREYFSSFRFDSGKIFNKIIFSRGPRTTYCTVLNAMRRRPTQHALTRRWTE